jgi:hypothetical protein
LLIPSPLTPLAELLAPADFYCYSETTNPSAIRSIAQSAATTKWRLHLSMRHGCRGNHFSSSPEMIRGFDKIGSSYRQMGHVFLYLEASQQFRNPGRSNSRMNAWHSWRSADGTWFMTCVPVSRKSVRSHFSPHSRPRSLKNCCSPPPLSKKTHKRPLKQ